MIGPVAVRVLVVDDDARVRQALRHLLDDLPGFECLAVDSGQAMRLATWGSAVTDVAVIDLPATSGGTAELIRRLIERLTDLMPVLVLSMSGSSRVAALEAGATRFFEKDGDSRALVAAIRTAVSQHPEALAPRVGLRKNVAREG